VNTNTILTRDYLKPIALNPEFMGIINEEEIAGI